MKSKININKKNVALGLCSALALSSLPSDMVFAEDSLPDISIQEQLQDEELDTSLDSTYEGNVEENTGGIQDDENENSAEDSVVDAEADEEAENNVETKDSLVEAELAEEAEDDVVVYSPLDTLSLQDGDTGVSTISGTEYTYTDGTWVEEEGWSEDSFQYTIVEEGGSYYIIECKVLNSELGALPENIEISQFDGGSPLGEGNEITAYWRDGVYIDCSDNENGDGFYLDFFNLCDKAGNHIAVSEINLGTFDNIIIYHEGSNNLNIVGSGENLLINFCSYESTDSIVVNVSGGSYDIIVNELYGDGYLNDLTINIDEPNIIDIDEYSKVGVLVGTFTSIENLTINVDMNENNVYMVGVENQNGAVTNLSINTGISDELQFRGTAPTESFTINSDFTADGTTDYFTFHDSDTNIPSLEVTGSLNKVYIDGTSSLIDILVSDDVNEIILSDSVPSAGELSIKGNALETISSYENLIGYSLEMSDPTIEDIYDESTNNKFLITTGKDELTIDLNDKDYHVFVSDSVETMNISNANESFHIFGSGLSAINLGDIVTTLYINISDTTELASTAESISITGATGLYELYLSEDITTVDISSSEASAITIYGEGIENITASDNLINLTLETTTAESIVVNGASALETLSFGYDSSEYNVTNVEFTAGADYMSISANGNANGNAISSVSLPINTTDLSLESTASNITIAGEGIANLTGSSNNVTEITLQDTTSTDVNINLGNTSVTTVNLSNDVTTFIGDSLNVLTEVSGDGLTSVTNPYINSGTFTVNTSSDILSILSNLDKLIVNLGDEATSLTLTGPINELYVTGEGVDFTKINTESVGNSLMYIDVSGIDSPHSTDFSISTSFSEDESTIVLPSSAEEINITTNLTALGFDGSNSVYADTLNILVNFPSDIILTSNNDSTNSIEIGDIEFDAETGIHSTTINGDGIQDISLSLKAIKTNGVTLGEGTYDGDIDHVTIIYNDINGDTQTYGYSDSADAGKHLIPEGEEVTIKAYSSTLISGLMLGGKNILLDTGEGAEVLTLNNYSYTFTPEENATITVEDVKYELTYSDDKITSVKINDSIVNDQDEIVPGTELVVEVADGYKLIAKDLDGNTVGYTANGNTCTIIMPAKALILSTERVVATQATISIADEKNLDLITNFSDSYGDVEDGEKAYIGNTITINLNNANDKLLRTQTLKVAVATDSRMNIGSFDKNSESLKFIMPSDDVTVTVDETFYKFGTNSDLGVYSNDVSFSYVDDAGANQPITLGTTDIPAEIEVIATISGDTLDKLVPASGLTDDATLELTIGSKTFEPSEFDGGTVSFTLTSNDMPVSISKANQVTLTLDTTSDSNNDFNKITFSTTGSSNISSGDSFDKGSEITITLDNTLLSTYVGENATHELYFGTTKIEFDTNGNSIGTYTLNSSTTVKVKEIVEGAKFDYKGLSYTLYMDSDNNPALDLDLSSGVSSTTEMYIPESLDDVLGSIPTDSLADVNDFITEYVLDITDLNNIILNYETIKTSLETATLTSLEKITIDTTSISTLKVPAETTALEVLTTSTSFTLNGTGLKNVSLTGSSNLTTLTMDSSASDLLLTGVKTLNNITLGNITTGIVSMTGLASTSSIDVTIAGTSDTYTTTGAGILTIDLTKPSYKLSLDYSSSDTTQGLVTSTDILTGGNATADTSYVFEAIARTGYEFDSWTIDGDDTLFSTEGKDSSTLTLTMIGDLTLEADKTISVVANFKLASVTDKDDFKLSLGLNSNDSTQGSVASETVSNGGTLTDNTSYEFTATPEDGYEFDSWTIIGDSTLFSTEGKDSSNLTLTINSDLTLTSNQTISIQANFKQKDAPKLSLDYSSSDTTQGLVTSTDISTGGNATADTSYVFEAIARTGYEFDSWTIDGDDTLFSTEGKDSSNLTLIINSDLNLTSSQTISIQANFKAKDDTEKPLEKVVSASYMGMFYTLKTNYTIDENTNGILYDFNSATITGVFDPVSLAENDGILYIPASPMKNDVHVLTALINKLMSDTNSIMSINSKNGLNFQQLLASLQGANIVPKLDILEDSIITINDEDGDLSKVVVADTSVDEIIITTNSDSLELEGGTIDENGNIDSSSTNLNVTDVAVGGSNLETVTLPESVTKVEVTETSSSLEIIGTSVNDLVVGSSNLETVTLPESVTTVDVTTEASSLEVTGDNIANIVVAGATIVDVTTEASSLEVTGDNVNDVVVGGSNLETVTLPESVTKVEVTTEASSLEVTGDSITEVAVGGSNLETVTPPASVEKVEITESTSGTQIKIDFSAVTGSDVKITLDEVSAEDGAKLESADDLNGVGVYVGTDKVAELDSNNLSSNNTTLNKDDLTTAEKPNINTDLSTKTVTYTQNEVAETLEVVVDDLKDGGTLSYQWFKDGNEISGATKSTYTPSTTTVGNFDYYCIVKNIDGVKYTITTSNTANITVSERLADDIAVKSITLSNDKLSLKVNDTETLTFTINPSNATNQNVTWKSSDEEIATIDSNGKVTAVDVGSVIITVTTADGEKTDTCLLTVTSSSSGNSSGGSSGGSGGGSGGGSSLGSSSSSSATTEATTTEVSTETTTADTTTGTEIVTPEVVVEPSKTLNIVVNTELELKLNNATTDEEKDAIKDEFYAITINKYSDLKMASYGEPHWGRHAVAFCLEQGYFDGVYGTITEVGNPEAVEFGSDDYATRLEIVRVLSNMVEDISEFTYTNEFSDLTIETEGANAVAWAVENGITTGTLNGFSPDENVDRQQMAIFFARFVDTLDLDLPVVNENVATFPDLSESTWGEVHEERDNSIKRLQEAGIMNGNEDGTFKPNSPISKAELATMIENFVNLLATQQQETGVAGLVETAEEIPVSPLN